MGAFIPIFNMRKSGSLEATVVYIIQDAIQKNTHRGNPGLRHSDQNDSTALVRMKVTY